MVIDVSSDRKRMDFDGLIDEQRTADVDGEIVSRGQMSDLFVLLFGNVLLKRHHHAFQWPSEKFQAQMLPDVLLVGPSCRDDDFDVNLHHDSHF